MSLETKLPGIATLALGLRPRQRGCKGAGQEKAQESHHILPRMEESVREWTLTLSMQLPLWEIESRWTLEISKNAFKGQNLMACGVFYIIGKLLEHKCLKWVRIAHLDIWTQVMAKRRAGNQIANLTPD
jgi:hypothetical protein